jgi:hypothetical protein
MAKRTKKDPKAAAVTPSTDDVTVVDGVHVLGINYYIRIAKAAMEERNWYDAWMAFGSALARCTDSTEAWELKQLETKCYRKSLPKKADRKQRDDRKDRKRRDSA